MGRLYVRCLINGEKWRSVGTDSFGSLIKMTDPNINNLEKFFCGSLDYKPGATIQLQLIRRNRKKTMRRFVEERRYTVGSDDSMIIQYRYSEEEERAKFIDNLQQMKKAGEFDMMVLPFAAHIIVNGKEYTLDTLVKALK